MKKITLTLLSISILSCNTTKNIVYYKKKDSVQALPKNTDLANNTKVTKKSVGYQLADDYYPDEFSTESKSSTFDGMVVHNDKIIMDVVEQAKQNIGSNYRTGGTTKSGFDCSGLMYATFKSFGITLPRTSNEQSRIGIKIAPKDAQIGDLIFFRTNGRGRINHVGLITEITEDEIKFIHSSIQRGVIISSTKETYYKNDFAVIKRIFD
ncbi:C40 family peptidase [Flavobacterium branchiophilum]|uniref:NlpC/P60 family protein n=1 Tax=Flavobacterium branchiophilum TaxID=55197 RepID=A0A543G0B6_9FLAO|nr:C40 family peptidase [Flavobacterium branchiophilum]TQM39533.1 NlpC/P60 family protein [Flavobacterium branchiophilum]GEM54060.1 hypothetical protein FB1_02810 [Flavobacterium branchiophilum NBRC 15030 = ATCC 35035]